VTIAGASAGAGWYSLDYLLFHGTCFSHYLHGWYGLAIAVNLGVMSREVVPFGNGVPV
jgi:putative oxidoreductase